MVDKSQARTMITQNLLFLLTSSSLLFLPFHFFQPCDANCSTTPSSCGILHNISSPFFLKNDLNNSCVDDLSRRYELVCENNVASIYLDSHKYLVKAIDYHSSTMRLSDVSINNNNNCSLTKYSTYGNYTFFHPFDWPNQPIIFLSCQNPLHNTSLFTKVTNCEKNNTHTYIKVGDLRPKDMENMCTIDFTLATSWDFAFSDNLNVSLLEIYQSLLYGFNISWFSFMCRNCESGTEFDCHVNPDGLITCDKNRSDLYYKWSNILENFRPPRGPRGGILMISMLILGVTIPGKIMITIGFGFSFLFQSTNWRRPNALHYIVASFGGRIVVGFLLAMGILIYKFRRRRLSMYEDIEGFLQSDNKLSPIRYSYSDIKKMTKSFREKLGEGGFGCVYKGKLRSGHYVAVKLLGKATVDGKDFINEIGTIGRIHHVNVVKLVGYCAERSKRALIFDFMPNGSLDKYILNRENANSLDWEVKFKIGVEVARGIEYLHCGCDMQILHFDIKPHNILLDDKMVPKISDFGLAKLCSIEKDTVTLTAARGTIGYVAPELINRGIGGVSYKADVYSFGMLLMEMVGLNKGLKGNNEDSTKYFPCWVYEHINQGREIEIEKAEEKNGDDGNVSGKGIARKMTIVALWCIQMNPDDRPSMSKVLGMLEDDVERLQIPEYRSQSAHMGVNEEEKWETDTSDSVSSLHYNNGSSIEISIA